MISVIIPAKDAEETIEDCLKAVLSQKNLETIFEVILVDDGSSDNTGDIAESYGVRLIRQENAGRSAARNTGAKIAQGDILAFTDADCTPSPEWLYHLTRPFEDPEIVGTKGTYRTNQTSLVPRFVQQEYAFKYVRMTKKDTIDFIDTYSAAYRRDIFWENMGFEDALLSVEDQEFSFRLARKGYHLVFVPDAVVYHHHVHTTWKYTRRKFEIGYWKAFMLRWLPEKTFGDSHTPPTLRFQILFLGLGLVAIFIATFFLGSARWLALAFFMIFYITALPFFIHIGQNDRKVLAVSPILLLLRAAGLGFGLAYGLVFPPRTQPRIQTGLSPFERVIKRCFDIWGALVGLVLFLPLFFISVIAIKFDSAGCIIFSQERAGENGKPFRVYKLRTMIDGSQDKIVQVLEKNSLNGSTYKTPDDPRVTRVGRVIRRWSIDECPQFWNILKGEMSLVGPRPEETWIVSLYNDSQRHRLVVKPGLTGPMQISGRGVLDMDARLALELEYINNYSIWKDIGILLRTFPAVISGRGAF
jgi:lipopolysaccharide/colanic/teichoic acid biosynthesis glycosyltransferase/glycosyltransferase involved in cell wall biosynthesis